MYFKNIRSKIMLDKNKLMIAVAIIISINSYFFLFFSFLFFIFFKFFFNIRSCRIFFFVVNFFIFSFYLFFSDFFLDNDFFFFIIIYTFRLIDLTLAIFLLSFSIISFWVSNSLCETKSNASQMHDFNNLRIPKNFLAYFS